MWNSVLRETGGAAEIAAITAAIASAIAVILTALRKRRDVNVEELEKRITDLTQRVEHLEGALDSARRDLVEAEHNTFVLRRTLAKHGISDPTLEEAS